MPQRAGIRGRFVGFVASRVSPFERQAPSSRIQTEIGAVSSRVRGWMWKSRAGAGGSVLPEGGTPFRPPRGRRRPEVSGAYRVPSRSAGEESDENGGKRHRPQRQEEPSERFCAGGDTPLRSPPDRACRPPPGELAGGRRSKPSPRFCAMGVAPLRGPPDRACRPPPGELAGGRRSRADGAIWTVGVPARVSIFTATGKRSAFRRRIAVRAKKQWRRTSGSPPA